jgi:hypothetical protein
MIEMVHTIINTIEDIKTQLRAKTNSTKENRMSMQACMQARESPSKRTDETRVKAKCRTRPITAHTEKQDVTDTTRKQPTNETNVAFAAG